MLEKGQFWMHAKTGHIYFITGFCKLEATNEDAVLYQRIKGPSSRPWARSEIEFLDGRFLRYTRKSHTQGPTPPSIPFQGEIG